MNKDRFFELLNLYLDEEIANDDLADLMEETRRDPERREVFIDYCRIHKACKGLGSSYQDHPRRRSLRQTVYALGGLAAAFALIGMAGRNLLPLINEQEANTVVAQQMETPPAPSFFPRLASDAVSSSDFYFGGMEPSPASMRVANSLSPNSETGGEWTDNLTFTSEPNILNLPSNTRFKSQLLDSELKEFYERFDAFGESSSIEFSSAASFAPASSFGQVVGRDSRSNLK